MAQTTAKRKPAQSSKAKGPKPGASGKMPAESDLVAAVSMLDGEPPQQQPKAQLPFRRSLID